ncbi:Beta-1,3-galactosyltransferase 1 [Stylophora pistillata]|uniref:Hexosyltransferase n=2 Tax=Stylophora pistillata TaxID=50429 RepID=A0A2B4RJW1_STYPI|nr:Beta-1,3-galactosyltransferase 1 [Stylophora pistillata]
MQFRGSRSRAIAVVSFALGCVLTRFLCSYQDLPVRRETNEEALEAVLDETSLPIFDPETIQPELFHPPENRQPVTTALKPTLPPYPPLLNRTAVILTPSTCNKDAFLVIIVVCSSKDFEARKVVRSSWGTKITEVKRYNSNSLYEQFQAYFVIGSDEINDERVEEESQRYDDIIRGNFMDTYAQINELHTVKTLLGLKWATTICDPQYILRVNAESFVNVQETIRWLHSLGNDSKYKEGLYTGYHHTLSSGGVKVIRNPLSPYFIPEDQWSDDLLPSYVSGVGVVLSRDVAEKIVHTASEMKLIHIDDVFLGVMAKKLDIAVSDHSPRFDIAYTTMLTECKDLYFCVIGGVPTKDMFYLHQNVHHLRSICATNESQLPG